MNSVHEGLTTLIIVTEEASGPTLLEFNHYQLDGEEGKRFHFNRAINYLSKINKIEMTDKHAYLIGEQVHYVYRHGIYADFLKERERIIFEFVEYNLWDVFYGGELKNNNEVLIGLGHYGVKFYVT